MNSNNPDITITLPMDKMNLALRAMGEEKFNVVADLIMEIRGMAGQYLQQLQQQQPQLAGGQPRPNGEDRGSERLVA